MSFQYESPILLLKEASNSGLQLWVENGKLKFKSSRQIEESLRNKIVSAKAELIALLSTEQFFPEKSQKEETFFPVLPMQEDIIKSVSLSDIKNHYNIPYILKYTGELSFENFKTALESVFQENAVLRARVVAEEDKYFHEISTVLVSEFFEYIDFSSYPNNEAVLKEHFFNFSHYDFSIEKGPLCKVGVVKKKNHEFYLCFLFHHLVFDGYSVDLLLAQLNHAYHQKQTGKKYQYNHFVKWYFLETAKKQEINRTFWCNEVIELQKLNLPYDFEQPDVLSRKGAYVSYEINLPFSKKLEELSKYFKITAFNFFLTVYVLFLRDYCNQASISVGIPTSLRHVKEWQETIGMFVNTLPVVLRLVDNESFEILLNRVSDKVRAIVSHNSFSAAELLKIYNQQQDSDLSELFQTMFLYEETAVVKDDFCDGQIEVYLPNDTRISKFDLTLVIVKTPNGSYQIQFEYSTDLFNSKTMENFLSGYNQLLVQISENTNSVIRDLSVMLPSTKAFYLNDFNHSSFLYNEKSIVELFCEQVATDPNAIAVVAYDKQLSYQELDFLSSQLAIYLSNHFDSNSMIAVNTTRSLYTLPALLGVLKAQCSYIPIDPEYPLERVQYILKDSHACLMIVNNETRNTPSSVELLNIDELFIHGTFQVNASKFLAYPRLDSRAYAIYTSGSTGQPKGVLIEHRALTHYVQWSTHQYIQGKGSGAPVHSSLAFDLTVTSLFAPLCAGKTVFMIHDSESIEGLVKALKERQDYSFIKITPAHLKILQHTLPVETLANIEANFVIGGEALYRDDLNELLLYCKKATFINEYGPTEATVGAMNFIFNSDSITPKAIPIGKPIANYKIYLLDYLMRPVPQGVIGEMYISGIGLAKGYLNKDDLNEEKFIQNPYANDLFSTKLYKTGDLAKFTDDNIITYVGRVDEQIKLNGYRIELGEIENCFMDVPHVENSVALIEMKDANKSITVYLITSDMEFLDILSLKKTAEEKLPFYMRPAQYKVVASIPLTLNGKVNRKKLMSLSYLPLIKKQNTEQEKLTHVQKELLFIWQGVFKDKNLDIESDFFSLGGESLIAIQLVAKIRNAGYVFSAKDLYRLQTIRAIGDYLQNQQRKTVSFDNQIVEGEIPLTPIQQWFFEQHFSNPDYYLQILPIEIKVSISAHEVKQLLNQLARSLDAFSIRFSEKNGEIYQYYEKLDEASVGYGYHFLPRNIKQLKSQEVENIYRQIQVFHGNLIHVLHLQEEGAFPVLVFIAHHLVIDGYSWDVIKTALLTLLSSQPVKQKANYKTWSYALKRYTDEISDSEKRIWKMLDDKQVYLNSICQISTNPVDADLLPSRNIERVQNLPLHVAAERFNHLHCNLGDVLLAALFKTLKPYYRTTEIPITIESYGRADVYSGLDLSDSIGWFTSFYPLIINSCYADLHSASCIRMIKDLREQVPNLGIGYLLSKNTKIELPAVCFNYLGNITGLNSSKLIQELSMESLPSPVASENSDNFGLVLNVWQEDQQLKISWKFKESFINEDSSNQFIYQFEKVFQQMIEELKNSSYHDISDKIQFLSVYSHETLDVFNQSDIEFIYPALSGQAFMFKQYKNNPHSNGFRSQAYWIRPGKADVTLVQKIWNELYQKIPALRVTFFQQEYLYQIQKKMSDELSITVLNYDRPFTSEDLNNQLLIITAGQFCLEGSRLFQVLILQYQDCYVQVFDHHHALLDGESVRIIQGLVEEGFAYRSIPEEKLLSLKENKAYFSGEKPSVLEAKAFWYEYLKGYEGLPQLSGSKQPLSFYKPVCYEGAVEVELENLSTQISQLAQQLNVSVSSIFEYAWAKMLSQELATSDIAFGIVSSGRSSLDEPDNYIGMLMNIIPVRVSFNKLSVIDNLAIQKLHAHLQELFTYDACFSLQEIESVCCTNLMPKQLLINTLYTFEHFENEPEIHDLQFKTITNSPLTVIIKWGNSTKVVLTYDKEVLDATTIELLASHFLYTIKTIFKEPICLIESH